MLKIVTFIIDLQICLYARQQGLRKSTSRIMRTLDLHRSEVSCTVGSFLPSLFSFYFFIPDNSIFITKNIPFGMDPVIAKLSSIQNRR